MKPENKFEIDTSGNLVGSDKANKKKYRSRPIDITGLNIGFYLATPILIGVFLGSVIDNKFHTQPYGVTCGILFGSIASIYNLIKFTKRNA